MVLERIKAIPDLWLIVNMDGSGIGQRAVDRGECKPVTGLGLEPLVGSRWKPNFVHFRTKERPKNNDLNDILPRCTRQIVSRSHDQRLLLVNGGGRPCLDLLPLIVNKQILITVISGYITICNLCMIYSKIQILVVLHSIALALFCVTFALLSVLIVVCLKYYFVNM